VVDDQLPAAIEEGSETLFPGRAVENIVLVDLHHRKPAALGVYAVELLGELLLMRQKFLSLRMPIVV
jgi:hypothetical protein